MRALIGRWMQVIGMIVLPIGLMYGLVRNEIRTEVRLLALGGFLSALGWPPPPRPPWAPSSPFHFLHGVYIFLRLAQKVKSEALTPFVHGRVTLPAFGVRTFIRMTRFAMAISRLRLYVGIVLARAQPISKEAVCNGVDSQSR